MQSRFRSEKVFASSLRMYVAERVEKLGSFEPNLDGGKRLAETIGSYCVGSVRCRGAGSVPIAFNPGALSTHNNLSEEECNI